MRIVITLLVSLLVVSTTACSKKWSEEVKQEMLEACTLDKAIKLPANQEGLQKAENFCKCVVEKTEKANPSPPKSTSMFKVKSLQHEEACAPLLSDYIDVGPCEDKTMRDRPEWTENARSILWTNCAMGKTEGILDIPQARSYCSCLVFRTEIANPKRFATDAEFGGASQDAFKKTMEEFFELAKPHESMCRGIHVGEHSLAIDEAGLRRQAYSKLTLRLRNDETGRRIAPYYERYSCASLEARESFFRCYYTSNLKWHAEQKRLGRDVPAMPISELEGHAATCAKENPPSK